jgi:hypothetical protein
MSGTGRPAPGLKTPFKDAVVWQAGKGNKKGVEIAKSSDKGSSNR